MKSLTYLGSVTKEGEIKLPKRLRAEVSAFLKGCEIEAIFRKKRSTELLNKIGTTGVSSSRT